MSSNYWQTMRQQEQLTGGQSVTQKAKIYCQRWEARCYADGIPDSVPSKIASAGRAPSYRAIALCILKNDLHLYGLGFAPEDNSLAQELYIAHKEKNHPQERLF